jgi:hypothetical protein
MIPAFLDNPGRRVRCINFGLCWPFFLFKSNVLNLSWRYSICFLVLFKPGTGKYFAVEKFERVEEEKMLFVT